MNTMVRVPYWRARSASALTCLISFLPAGGAGDSMNSRFGLVRDDLRERGFAGAGRSPEDERASVVALDLRVEGLAGTDQVFLAGVLLERARTHAVGQRAGAVGCVGCVRNGFEKSHGKPFHHRDTEKTGKLYRTLWVMPCVNCGTFRMPIPKIPAPGCGELQWQSQ